MAGGLFYYNRRDNVAGNRRLRRPRFKNWRDLVIMRANCCSFLNLVVFWQILPKKYFSEGRTRSFLVFLHKREIFDLDYEPQIENCLNRSQNIFVRNHSIQTLESERHENYVLIIDICCRTINSRKMLSYYLTPCGTHVVHQNRKEGAKSQ